MPAPPTCTREATLNAEVEAVDAAEEVEGVVDDAWVKEPDAEAELSARTGGGPGYGDRARSRERTCLSIDIVDIGDIHEFDGIPMSARVVRECMKQTRKDSELRNALSRDLGKGGAEGTEARVNFVDDNILAVEAKDWLMSSRKGFTWFATTWERKFRNSNSFDQLQGVMSFISFASVVISRHPFSQCRLPSSASTTLLFVVHRQVSATSRHVSAQILNFITPHYLRPFEARPSRIEALAAHTAFMVHPDT
ncbi:hypothetical protein ARMGADRAFT_1081054 [Armillaria gallica]|uniref:Uncharacterized protein n=1 Tax=Armillaria gallica TaxID=47427 RepID=A0A2H3DN52_ARMGA|nr:hypothetical protein ARMGADRAFT_1081054 [Armillaria gallica]